MALIVLHNQYLSGWLYPRQALLFYFIFQRTRLFLLVSLNASHAASNSAIKIFLCRNKKKSLLNLSDWKIIKSYLIFFNPLPHIHDNFVLFDLVLITKPLNHGNDSPLYIDICDSVLFGYKLLISILVISLMKIAQFQRIKGLHYIFHFFVFHKI